MCVLLQHFPLRCETLGNPDIENSPVLVIYGAGSKKQVLDWSPDLNGIRKEMPLHQALARQDKVEIIQADLPRYNSAFNMILDRLETVSPLVENADTGTAYIGVDGLQLIYPDDDSLAEVVRSTIPEAFPCRMGIAGGKFPAFLAALNSHENSYKVLSGTDDFVKDLSCGVLPVPMKVKNKLHEFGINTLGQLAVFPSGPLQSQFGPEGKRIRELARGIDDTPLYPRKAEEFIEENTSLSSVTVSIDTVLVAMEPLVSRIFARISRTGKGIHSLTLWTRGYNAEHWERVIRFKKPAMDVNSTLSRIKLVLENYPQPGPVEQAGISVTRLGYPRGRQNSLFSEVRSKDHLLDDIRQLELRQGNPQVFQLKEIEPWSRIPERRYALIPTGR
jgi:DNA polymerase-4/protein ImuB